MCGLSTGWRIPAALAALFTAFALNGCGESTEPLAPVSSFTFSELNRNEAVGFELSESGEPLLLVRVDGNETAFESRVSAPGGEVLSAARLPYLRAGPIFHVVEIPPGDALPGVSIQPDQVTRNSSLRVRLYRLSENTPAGAARVRAFRDYEAALQASSDESAGPWKERRDRMRAAARGLELAGDREPGLWAGFLAAYISYYPLYEFDAAIEEAGAVRARARSQGLVMPELMALQLESQARLEQIDPKASLREKRRQAQAALEVIDQAVRLAAAEGLRFEQAWAQNNRGIARFYQDALPEALAAYQEAMSSALELEDVYLVNLVGGNVALVNERLGDHAGALGALLAIRQELLRYGSPADIAHNLTEIGRVYGNLFLFPEAIEALNGAMEISRDLGIREGTGRIGLFLARAYHGMGRNDRALEVLPAAIEDMEAIRFDRGLREAYRLRANLYRHKGQAERMAADRDRQGDRVLTDLDRADWMYDRALDALSAGREEQALEWFGKSRDLAETAAYAGIQVRAALQACLLESRPEAAQGCSADGLGARLSDWLPSATPREAFEARFAWARWLAGRDRGDESLATLADLVKDIRLYRAMLPGVLGAWYWESRQAVFTFYLDLLLRQPESTAKAVESLLLLDDLRNLDASLAKETVSEGAENAPPEQLRDLLASLEQAGDGASRRALAEEIDRLLLAAGAGQRAAAAPAVPVVSLRETLPPESVFLAYYLSGRDAWAWVVRREGVSLVPLGEAGEIRSRLQRTRAGLRAVGNTGRNSDLERLGRLLLGPLGELPRTLFLGAGGALAGFPLDALRRGERFLARDHEVVNVLSLRGLLSSIEGGAASTSLESAFIAGAPSSGDRAAELAGARAEIEELGERLGIGRSRVVTGPELVRGSFMDPAFTGADLVHLATHGTIHLDYPEGSRLLLSTPDSGTRPDYLTPLDIRGSTMQAALVVLSACETTGSNRFAFDSHLGFVTEFLQAGAGSVVASLWPVPDQGTGRFMSRFYARLLAGESTAQALAYAKRQGLAETPAGAGLDWVAFQLYTR
jgi:hypothetical protein